MLTLGLGFI